MLLCFIVIWIAFLAIKNTSMCGLWGTAAVIYNLA